MDKSNFRLEKVWTTPIFRYRVLINQRVDALKSANIIDMKFLDSLYERKKEIDKHLKKQLKTILAYFAIIYFSLNEGDLEIPFLKIQISEVPSIIEIATVMLSLNLIFFAVRFIDDAILRQTIDSVLSHHYSHDEILNGVIKNTKYPDSTFWSYFSLGTASEPYSILPRLYSGVFHLIMPLVAVAALLLLLLFPIGFLTVYVCPLLPDTVPNLVIKSIVALSCLFYLLCFVSLTFKFPYTETTVIQK